MLPAHTTTIEANAFEGTEAYSAEIPASCTYLGSCAFKNCTNLAMIRIPKGCTLDTDVFDGCTEV